MKLLTSVLPRARRLLPTGGWFTLAFCGFIFGLEVVGRWATTDFHDGLLGSGVGGGHRRSDRPPSASSARRGSAAWPTGSADSVRGSRHFGTITASTFAARPPIPRRTPPAVWLVGCGPGHLGSAGGGSSGRLSRRAGERSAFTRRTRSTSSSSCCSGRCCWRSPSSGCSSRSQSSTSGSSGGWATPTAGARNSLPWSVTRSWSRPSAGLSRRRRCSCCASSSPLGSLLVYLPRGSDGAALLWRSGPDSPVYAVPVRRVLALVTLLASLLVFAVLLTACGGWLFGAPRSDDAMPVTSLFGRVAAWLMPALLIVVLGFVCIRRDAPIRPAEPPRPRTCQAPIPRRFAPRLARSARGAGACGPRRPAAIRTGRRRGRSSGAVRGDRVRSALAAQDERRRSRSRSGEAAARPP